MAAGDSIAWAAGNLSSVGGHACKVFGQLEVIDTDQGEAAELWGDDDRDDGLKLQVLNPLAQPCGWVVAITAKIVFTPYAGGRRSRRLADHARP